MTRIAVLLRRNLPVVLKKGRSKGMKRGIAGKVCRVQWNHGKESKVELLNQTEIHVSEGVSTDCLLQRLTMTTSRGERRRKRRVGLW